MMSEKNDLTLDVSYIPDDQILKKNINLLLETFRQDLGGEEKTDLLSALFETSLLLIDFTVNQASDCDALDTLREGLKNRSEAIFADAEKRLKEAA
jgi:hypothetical protein